MLNWLSYDKYKCKLKNVPSGIFKKKSVKYELTNWAYGHGSLTPRLGSAVMASVNNWTTPFYEHKCPCPW